MITINKVVIPAALVVVLVAAGGFYVNKTQSEVKSLKSQLAQASKNPQDVAKAEIIGLTAQMSKLVVLPEGEDPVLATVTDKEKLKDQPVFAKAENGDKILIYSNAKKAYLYRPGKNLIIDVVPVNIGDATPTIAGVDVNKPLKVALVNGTSTPNLTSTLEKRIVDSKISGIQVTAKTSGKLTDYKRTQVLDLTGKLAVQAKQLATLIDGDVATETSEVKPNADIMVIIGGNFK